jgi:hypothetical protein
MLPMVGRSAAYVASFALQVVGGVLVSTLIMAGSARAETKSVERLVQQTLPWNDVMPSAEAALRSALRPAVTISISPAQGAKVSTNMEGATGHPARVAPTAGVVESIE